MTKLPPSKSLTTTKKSKYEHDQSIGDFNGYTNATTATAKNPASSIAMRNPNENDCQEETYFDAISELSMLFQIALPTVAVQFCTFIIFPITASYVGRDLTTDDMGAFSLASLSGNLTTISIIIGILSASETLQPRAFAVRDYEEVGIIALRGLFMCVVCLAVPVGFLMTCVKPIFTLLGQDAHVASLSDEWIHIYIWSVPFILCYRVIQRFLASQSIVIPCLVGAAISSLIVHPLCIKFWISKYQFVGSAMSIVVTQSIQLIITVLYIKYTKSYVQGTWKGINWRIIQKVFDRKGLLTYASLSFGGIIALTEWWYWECICFVAGRLGVIALCVHSVIYQIIPLVYMIPLGMSIGLSVRIGQLLPIDVNKAKILTVYAMLTVIIVALMVTALLYYNETWIVSLFTSEEDVMNGCKQIWPKVCMYILGLYIFCLNSGILRALGLQWRMGLTIIIVLWCFSLPSIIYFCIYQNEVRNISSNDIYIHENDIETGIDGLVTLWEIFFWSYIILDIALILCYTTVDWNEIGKQAAQSMKSNRKDYSNTMAIDDDLSYEENEGLVAEDASLLSFNTTGRTLGSISYYGGSIYDTTGRSFVSAFVSSSSIGDDNTNQDETNGSTR